MGKCSYHNYITVNPPSGYIWSHADNEGCVWKVEVEPGQTINLTLFDFMTSDEKDKTTTKHYAQVLDHGKKQNRLSITGGGGQARERSVYISSSNVVDITLAAFNPAEEDKPRFLIKYEAIGCPDPPLPVGAEMKKLGTTLVITCPNNKRWTLRCEGTEYFGDKIGTCSDNQEEAGVFNVLSPNWSSKYSLLVIIGGALIIGILIGACCLGVCFCVRRRRKREREAVAYREHERYNAHPACRRPYKNGPHSGQPNALTQLNPRHEPPPCEQDEDYDKPYYANGTVPSWMGYRPLPVPTYEDIMFNQDRSSRSPLPPHSNDHRFSTSDDPWFNMHPHGEFDPQFNTTGRMMRPKRGLKVGLDGNSKPVPAPPHPPQYYEYDPANREYEKPRPYRHDEDDTPTKKYTKRRKQSSGDLELEDETARKGNNTM